MHEQFGYAYDAAGNLNYRTNNALTQTFAVNSLNELGTVTRNGTLTVAGTTTSTATNVTVNSLTAALYNDKMFAATNFTLADGNNTFTAIAQDSYGRKDTNAVTFNLPATNSYVYDLNGNLTSDGTRGFDYDDENELIRVTVTNKWKSEFTYDGKFRQRIRKEFTWQSSTWIYDGNVVIQLRDANNLPTLTLTRTANRLLARSDMTTLTPSHAYFHTDGNANVTALVNGQQVIVARYVYDPFGNSLSKSGPLADANLYRFSSQEYHQNSGLLLYLRRAYDPNLQRWLNRDPIAEQGGLNLYAFVNNNPINLIDPLGLLEAISAYKYWMGVAVNGASTGGILGNAQAAGASIMTSFIDFFGARNVEGHAGMAGAAAGKGESGQEALYVAATFGDIVLAAAAGWTGGGGAAAKGVRLTEVGWYEVGSQTINGAVYRTLAEAGMAANKVELGKYLVKEYGWFETLFKFDELSPSLGDWLPTLWEGPTPGGYVSMMALTEWLQKLLHPCE